MINYPWMVICTTKMFKQTLILTHSVLGRRDRYPQTARSAGTEHVGLLTAAGAAANAT